MPSYQDLDATAVQHGGIAGRIAGTTKNPISAVDWQITHAGQPYQAELSDGTTVIVFGDGAQLTIRQDTSTSGRGGFASTYQVVKPLKEADTGKPSPFADWKAITDQGGRKGMQDPKTGVIEWTPASLAGAAGQPTIVHASDGVYSIDHSSGQPVATKLDGVPGTRDPAQDNQANAAANASNANAASTAARTPSEIAAAQASANASNASARNSDLQGQLVSQRAALEAASAPLERTQIQANIDRLNAEIAAASKPSLVTTDTSSRLIGTMGPDGTIQWTPNQNYQSGKPALEPGYQNNPKIPELVQGEDGQWTVQWIDNQGQAAVPTDTLQTLAQQIGVKLGDGSIPLDTAKSLFDMAHQVISDQTNQQVANNQGANVGAGLLQSRMTNATSTVNSVLSGAASNKNFGLGTQLPAGWGSQFLNETNQNLTALGGGQSTFDTAAQLVHNAAPAIQNTATGAAASAAVKLMLDAGQKPVNPPVAPAAAAPPQLRGNASGVGGNGTGVSATPFQAAGFQAPTTTIAPDGTVTIQHTPDSGSSPSGFRAPVMAGVM